MNVNEQEESRFAGYMARAICDRASGRSDAECVRNYPRDVYFVGNLRPFEDSPSTGKRYLGELMNKLSPVALGAEFRIGMSGDAACIKVTLSWSCYYRVLPTLQQQLQHQGRGLAEGSNTVAGGRAHSVGLPLPGGTAAHTDSVGDSGAAEVVEEPDSGRRRRTPRDRLFLRFQKVGCNACGRVTVKRGSGRLILDPAELQASINAECERAGKVAAEDPARFRTDGGTDNNVQVPDQALSSQAAFDAFLSTLRTEVNPVWRLEARVDVRQSLETGFVPTFQFVNMSPAASEPKNPNLEHYLFDVGARFEFADCEVRPFELELAARGFRYDRDVWGRGLNCAVCRNLEGDGFITSHAPVFGQMRYEAETRPRASFADLARDPVPVLRSILKAMEAYKSAWKETREAYEQHDSNWAQRHGVEYQRAYDVYSDEILRFQEGLQLIERNTDVLLAFKLTNETFRRGAKSEWRMFQIVFMVTQIAGIVAMRGVQQYASEREAVDIIYFPTGGGKTEAYLSVVVFHCFFDRLRGKSAGTTAWTRFPLRLLTIQQTQRVADLIGLAELVRREQKDNAALAGESVDGFAVGYFVGQSGSPNELADPNRTRNARAEMQVSWSKANDPATRQGWKRVVRCPSCKTASVRVDFDPKRGRLVHRCTRPNCAFPDGELPVYIVDNEIYRYLPAVIVGTIDKLAGLGNQRKMAQIFGSVDGQCVLHGYYKGKCCQKDCSDQKQLKPGKPKGLSGPTLFVQDELHLLKEGLGTFDGHYETFTQQLLLEFGQNLPLKVIASSATIEAFDRQVEHLYGRTRLQARIFPGAGPELGESFYAHTLEVPQRLFVGIIPHNKTIFNTILELIELYHRELAELERMPLGSANPWGGELGPGSPDWIKLLDLYRTSLTYFLAGRELNSIRTDIEGDVNPNLAKDGLRTLNVFELTGSTTTDDVQAALEHLEKSADAESPPDAVLATSMVSHGVDIDRLNAMIFYGMPRQNAEYIQASSRVGRCHVGLVLTCLHPARERDQSHYAYFIKFHEYLGQLVEPVAINRWAKFSIDRTLPGLFMGVLLQLLANRAPSNPDRYYVIDYVKQFISNGSIKAEHFIPILEKAYFMGDVPPNVAETFRQEIRERVKGFLDQVITAGSGRSFVSDVLIPRPMRSLRDVDEPIEIELDTEGSVWGSKLSQRRRINDGPEDD